MTRPAVIFGGPSPEHDVSILTGLQAARALLDSGTDVGAIYWAKTGAWYEVPPTLEAEAFAAGIPARAQQLELVVGPGGGFEGEARLGRRRRLEIDAILNCCHGGPGEDGSVQAAFDLAGLRYTGPSAPGAALGMDKLAFGGVVRAAALPSLPRELVTADTPPPAFAGPYIVKPRYGGSSIGIHVADDHATARALVRTQPLLRAGAVLEPYRPDAVDLNVSVRSYPSLQVSAVERPIRGAAASGGLGGTPGGAIYSYAEKYLGGEGLSSARRELPAAIPAEVAQRITDAAIVLAPLVELRGIARIDYLWAGDELYVNEINTIPGALAKYFWEHAGIPFAQQLRDVLAEAAAAPTRRFDVEGADGAALRAARSIADKLA
jgi:D-alanine-D-alanine ligase